VDKVKISIGYSEDLIQKFLPKIRSLVEYLELYLSPEQYYKTNIDFRKNFDAINLLFNFISDKVDFLSRYKENYKIIKEINPDIITTSSYLFGEYLAKQGHRVETSIVNVIDHIGDVYELNRIGFTGYCLPPYKNYDFDFMRESKKFFPGMRIKLIANNFCGRCIRFAERHETIYYGNSRGKIEKEIDSMIGCNLITNNTLKMSIVTPSMLNKYNDVDIFKFATRRDRPELFESVINFLENKDTDYLRNLFTVAYRRQDVDEDVKKFINLKKLCLYECFKCNYCESK